MSAVQIFSSVSFLAALVVLAAAAIGIWRVRGSTAMPAAGWAVAASLGFALEMGVRSAGGFTDSAAATAIRLAVVSLSLCPAMSLLGAKRPQHGVWQLIVATLAVVLSLPALTALAMRPGSVPDVHLLARGLMLILVLVGWLNFVATGRGFAATMISLGQLILMRPLWPIDWPIDSYSEALRLATSQPVSDCVAAVFVAVGSVLTQQFRLRATRASSATVRDASLRSAHIASIASLIDPPFLALRETLGAAWALRIAERFCTIAATRGWPCRLHFSGLDEGGDPADGQWQRDALRAFTSLMRRFVSKEWLYRHRSY